MKVSALYSNYVIDGVQMDNTPAQMLNDCIQGEGKSQEADTERKTIVDEVADPAPKRTVYDRNRIPQYLEKIRKSADRSASCITSFPASRSRRKIADALLSALWKKGHFGLYDLEIRTDWHWDPVPLGNMAAFYLSAEAVSEYIFDLGVKLTDYSYSERPGAPELEIGVSVSGKEESVANDEYDFLSESEIPSAPASYCWISDEEKCGHSIVPDKSSWLIYIPFETCDYRLGDSVLEKLEGTSGERAPEMRDPDYFIDCYEVVRELMEDGIVISGATVGAGGLAAAAASMCGETGLCMDISGIESSFMEHDIVRIMFGETPGAIIQIRDSDYDYIDAQFLLQEIAWYPIGHPDLSSKDFSYVSDRKPGVSDILASLIQGQSSEGED